MSKKRKPQSVKVNTRVTPETYRRLDEIRRDYGFRSVYEIVQSLIHCFLCATAKEGDTREYPVPYEIEEMFSSLADGERHVEFEKPKRRAPAKSVNDE